MTLDEARKPGFSGTSASVVSVKKPSGNTTGKGMTRCARLRERLLLAGVNHRVHVEDNTIGTSFAAG
jgi:hypothetical protein